MKAKTGTRTGQDVTIDTGDVSLPGILTGFESAHGIVVFAHGSGSSRFSPRNREVATFLNEKGLATLLFDLLTEKENETDQFTREYRFDIARLARRLEGAVTWLRGQPDLSAMKVGLFGASTGAAAALITAASLPGDIDAVVSRGGRPDLAGDALDHVVAPVLLIVGGLDGEVIRLNEQAAGRLHGEHHLAIVPGATHLFEEPGKLEEVCRLAGYWFQRYLGTESVDSANHG